MLILITVCNAYIMNNEYIMWENSINARSTVELYEPENLAKKSSACFICFYLLLILNNLF